ncbi:MAG: arylamine N-acetyltransferase [Bacteroidota bacterium]
MIRKRRKPRTQNIDVHAYLERIGLKQEQPSFAFLKKLIKHHLLAIPFENLDIHYGKKILLDYNAIYKKVVLQGRGGFCYELNGLFFYLLQKLGFTSTVLSAEVYNRKKSEFGRPFDHMFIAVKLDGALFLVDVGFGEGYTQPLKFDLKKSQVDFVSYWKTERKNDDFFYLMRSQDNTSFESVYRFKLNSREIIEFIAMCDYHQVSENSSFKQQKLITILTTTGRKTLTDRKFVLDHLGKKEEISILNEDEFLSKLQEHFGISYEMLYSIEN